MNRRIMETPSNTQIFFHSSREFDITKERIQKILAAGANVILTTGGIDDLCLKYFVEAGAMAIRRCKKADLRRIAKATGGTEFCAIILCDLLFAFRYANQNICI